MGISAFRNIERMGARARVARRYGWWRGAKAVRARARVRLPRRQPPAPAAARPPAAAVAPRSALRLYRRRDPP